MYTQRRFNFKSLLVWTKRELTFFTILASSFTILYEILDIKWLQLPLAPLAMVGTAVAFMLGFLNNAAYDRAWEARKIWGGIVNTSRSLIITVRDSFYIHRAEAYKDESDEMKVIAHRHVAWLNALRYAMRTTKQWEAKYGMY
ncbi:MAG: bestrophin family protein, partial [Schleiferiaceae bacterium]|nr:bestrophin family protein [Schleiferiaceae bacterium]